MSRPAELDMSFLVYDSLNRRLFPKKIKKRSAWRGPLVRLSPDRHADSHAAEAAILDQIMTTCKTVPTQESGIEAIDGICRRHL